MCRRNCLWGWMLISFGGGMLLGTFLESGFLICCIGIGMIALGMCVLQKN